MTEHSKSLSCFVYISAVLLLCGSVVTGQVNNDNAPASETNSIITGKPGPADSEAKDGTDKSAVNAAAAEVNPDEKNIIKKTGPRIENKDTKQVKKEDAAPGAAVKKEDQPVGLKESEGLLSITEGSYKYKRIPGIKIQDDTDDSGIEKKYSNSQVVVISSGEDIPGDGTGEDNKKGIFGVSKKTGDTVILVTLLIIIVGVIIILKFKSKGKDDHVLRRFPRA